MKTLGLDIGSNSVGSAWVDTSSKTIRMGVSVFPAGVKETDKERGAPKNQARREARSMMRSIRRRAERKRKLRALLVETGLLPKNPDDFDRLVRSNRWPISETLPEGDKDRTVWHLRVEAMERKLHPFEFGRVLVHLNQRRGALGVEIDTEEVDGEEVSKGDTKKKKDKIEKRESEKVKQAIIRLNNQLDGRTIGQFMLAEMLKRRTPITGKNTDYAQGPIRNRRDSYEFHADRTMVRDEFNRIWMKQAEFGGELALLLTDSLKEKLDSPDSEDIWREQGAIFGQRKTYWDTGTLGRCDLEPTDRCCPKRDMYAQHYRVIETVNNIRVMKRGASERGLTPCERDTVIAALRKTKIAKVATVRTALKIDKRSLKKIDETEDFYSLNIERDEEREINTDPFWREIVHGVFGEDRWNAMDEKARESVNRALLRFDKDAGGHEQRLRTGCRDWWGLDEEQTEALVKSWKARGRTENRMSISRRAIRNVLPYMERYDEERQRWRTQIEAKQMFALDPEAIDQTTGNTATREQRVRYAHDIHCEKLRHVLLTQLDGDVDAYEKLLKLRGSTKDSRHFEAKHPDLLPPAPMMSNPVVRKAIHEVRRHVMAHIAAAGCKPDRVVIELAREARQSGKVRDAVLKRNRNRNDIRKKITSDYLHAGLSKNQLRMAQDRVLLCRRQRGICAYSRNPDGSGVAISERAAAKGCTDDGISLEVDHIVPYSRCGDNSLNNKVLCYVKQNRGKGKKTVKEWWKNAFEDRIQPLAFIEKHKKTTPGDYFTKKDYARLWENLTREVKPEDEWRKSQLTDTAYAGTQVMEYLRDALFDGVQKSKGSRGVYETNGRYTYMLGRDWQLIEKGGKDRDDHRHHAVDAVVIALTEPYQLLPVLAKQAEDAEEYHDRTGYWPKRDPDPTRRLIPKAWEDHLELRTQVMAEKAALLVSHRPVKTKLVGALHKANPFGCLPEHKGLFTRRIKVEELNFAHLRPPISEKTKDAVQRIAHEWLQSHLGGTDASRADKKKAKDYAERIVASSSYKPRLVDPAIGKGGLARDVDLRKQLYACVDQWCRQQDNGFTADNFTTKGKVAEVMVKHDAFRHKSGVPIRTVILLRTMKDPPSIGLRRWDDQQHKMVLVEKNREMGQVYSSDRIFEGQNNHHIPIREDEKGMWSGNVVTAYDALRRVRQGHGQAVDRSDDTERGGRFIMSLAEGETIHMCHPDTQEPGYFVVFKLDNPRTIHFKHHTDARLAGGRKEVIEASGKMKAIEIPGSKREDIAVVVSDIKKKCSFSDGTPPIKVRVSPLGEITDIDERIRPVEAELSDLDPRVVTIAKEALALRQQHPSRNKDKKTGKPLPGSWRWMLRQLEDQGIEAKYAPELTPALRLLKESD